MDKSKYAKLMYLLKVSQISHLMATTPLGALECKIDKEENEYYFTLDSVRCPKDLDKKLKELYNV